MGKDIKKEYSNGELTVVWKPSLCIHAAECVKHLPDVYDPNSKPWIKAENASTEDLKAQISLCPSGALSYYMPGDKRTEQSQESSTIQIDIMANGPILVHGSIKIKGIDGKEELKNETTAFCRCGASSNKPFCDGSHKKIGFSD